GIPRDRIREAWLERNSQGLAVVRVRGTSASRNLDVQFPDDDTALAFLEVLGRAPKEKEPTRYVVAPVGGKLLPLFALAAIGLNWFFGHSGEPWRSMLPLPWVAFAALT